MTATTATKTVTFKSGLLGTVVLNSYVDPFPGAKGTDTKPGTCPRCGGSGYFDCFRHIYSGRCFKCFGVGTVPVKVSTHRRHAKIAAFATEYADQIANANAVFEAAQQAARAAEDFAADWDAAHAEAAIRNARVQGFLGEVGEKIAATGTVAVAKYMSGSYNRSATMFLIVNVDGGQVIKISGSANSLFSVSRGDRVQVTGKVKAHTVYNGQDQTVLTFAQATVLDAPEEV
jgi:hypothetical protein